MTAKVSALSGGQICIQCKWCHVVAKFSPSYRVNFWVRCASGNVLVGFQPIFKFGTISAIFSDFSVLAVNSTQFGSCK